MNPVRNFVTRQFEKPNLVIAVSFFLLPFVMSVIVGLLLGQSIDFLAFAILLGKGFLHWIAITFILYSLLYAFKGKDVSGKLLSIATSYSLVYVFLTIGSLVILGIAFYLFGALYQDLISNGYVFLGQPEVVEIIKEKAPSQIATVLGFIGIALSILFSFVGSFAVVYYIGNAVKKTSFFLNSVFTIIFFAVVAGLSAYIVIF